MSTIQILEDMKFRRLPHRAVLKADDSLEVIGSYDDPHSFLEALSRQESDIAIISFIKNWLNRGQSTEGIVRRIKREYPNIKCILLADPEDGLAILCQLYEVGLDAFALKNDPFYQPPLNEIVHIVYEQGYYFHAIATKHLLDNYRHNSLTRRKENISSLTESEQEVLIYTELGYKQSEIAEKLGYSVANIKFHADRAREKVEAHSTTEAVFKARLYELIDQDLRDEIIKQYEDEFQ